MRLCVLDVCAGALFGAIDFDENAPEQTPCLLGVSLPVTNSSDEIGRQGSN
jgi:hypothetical protein